MIVEVNNKEVEFGGNLLSELLAQLELGDSGYAVAVGNFIISKASRDSYQLKDGDQITIIVATHGG